MRLSILLLCLCAAAAMAADEKKDVVKDEVKKVEMMKNLDGVTLDEAIKKKAEKLTEKVMADKLENETVKEEDGLVKLPGSDKTWGETVQNLHPTAEVFAANLPKYTKSVIKPQILSAYVLEDELSHWNKNGNPATLTFIGDDGEPNYAVMSSEQPVILKSYGKDVKFHLFTKYNESDIEGFRITDLRHLVDAGFDSTLPLKVIIHGFTNSIKSPAIQLVKNALLETGRYNVIGVDWGRLCRGPWYPGARAHVTGAGAKVGEFLDALIDLELIQPSGIHMVGHSLGAHVAGIASKSMNRGKIARITGLDPAGPLFQLTSKDGIIWRDDADLVDIIHTNAGYLGKSKHLGHVDFYPNGGHFQPGCPFDWTGSCSHGRSYEFFASTIRNPDTVLEAVLCDSLPSGTDACERSFRQRGASDLAQMGYHVKFEKEGAYFLKTSETPSYKFV